MGGNNPKSVWWNDEVKAADKRKEAAWKEVLGARNEDAKEICMKAYRKERRKEVNEQFRRKINQDVKGNMKWFWNEVRSRIKDGNGRLALEQVEM